MNQLIIEPANVALPVTRTLEWILAHMDVRDSTAADYTTRMHSFVAYLLVNGVNENTLISYKRQLASDSTIRISTKNKKLTVARIFLRELHRRGFIDKDITLGIKGFRQSTKHKQNGLDDNDIRLLKEWIQCNQANSPMNLRITIILLLLTYQGLRQIELCRLEYEDIDFAGQRIFIHGKGRDDKEPIHMSPDVSKVLKEYCNTFHIVNGYVFYSISNNYESGRPLTTRGLRTIIMKLFSQVGIDKNVHGIRHYYVTKLVEEFPGDLFMVMRFTRHRSLEQLQVYNDAVLHTKDFPKHDKLFSNVLFG